MNNNNNNIMSDSDFMMISDCMKAIETANCENWVKGFDGDSGFMFSRHENMRRINENIEFGGHSGASFGATMRSCQYYLNNYEEWDIIKQQYIDQQHIDDQHIVNDNNIEDNNTNIIYNNYVGNDNIEADINYVYNNNTEVYTNNNIEVDINNVYNNDILHGN